MTTSAANWNILTDRHHVGTFATYWHTNHTEAQARKQFAELTKDSFFGTSAYKLVEGSQQHWTDTYVPKLVLDAEGTVHATHRVA